jgi:ParB family transcriptional regulator, chromosome partitioning protein
MSLSPSTSDNAAKNAGQQFRELPLDAVCPNPAQPRRYFDEAALEALAGSMRERGVLQPVLVRPRPGGMHELIAGERRWRAAQLAGLQRIPALVSTYDDRATLEVGLIENMARKDLSPVEEARACATLVEEFGMSYREVGIRVARHRRTVSDLIRLLQLSEDILEFLDRGELGASHGKVLLLARDPQVRSQLARMAVKEGWSVRKLESHTAASNIDGLPPRSPKEQVLHPRVARDQAAQKMAKAWGDVLGIEVNVRVLSIRQMRMEVIFETAEGGVAMAERLAAAIARGSQGG